VVEADARPKDAHGMGLRLVTRPARRTHLHRQRQRERSFVAAFDARTGNELWRADREGEGSNWATPFVWQNDRRTEIVTTGTKGVRSYDLSGKLLWQLTGMTSIHAVTPFASHGLLFVSSGYFPDAKRPTYAIRPGAFRRYQLERRRARQRVHRLVESDAGAGISLAARARRSVLHADGSRLRDIERSEEPAKRSMPRQRIAPDAGTFSASPWAYNGKLFAISEDGDTVCVAGGTRIQGASAATHSAR
jgi:hypothetical protein